ncbi:MAG: hypothetical protein ACO1SV_17255 [Fimbriimonas sp.]
MAPMLPAVLFLMIPIVAILTKHQQNMARILHGEKGQNQVDSQLLAEIAALRQLVAQQSLTLDDLSRRQSELSQRLDGDRTIRDRLNA